MTMNSTWSVFSSIGLGVLSFGVIYAIAGFALLKANPPTPQYAGVHPLTRLQRLIQARRKDVFCALAIFFLVIMLWGQYGTARYYDAQWSDCVEYLHQAWNEKAALEAQNEQLKAENSALKVRVEKAALKTAMKPVPTTSEGPTLDGIPTVWAASVAQRDTLLLRDINRQFAASSIPVMLYCNRGTCGINVRPQDELKVRSIVKATARKYHAWSRVR